MIKNKSWIPLWFAIVFFGFLPTIQADSFRLPQALQQIRALQQHSGYTRDNIQDCLTSVIDTVGENWQQVPSLYRRELQGLFLRPDKPGGYGYLQGLPLKFRSVHFRFHYTLSGPDAVPAEDVAPHNGVPDYVDLCAEAFERAYHIEIELMGFKAPLDDFWMPDNGGDEKLDVYLFSGPWLGFTAPEWYQRVLATAATGIPYFGMNSRIYDYFGKSEGNRFLQTTAAHEFLHAIQFAYSFNMPRWFMEASSTWMESNVYDGGLVDDGDDIPDPDELGEIDAYDQYSGQLRRWLHRPDISLYFFNGDHEYGSVIWVHYITERFGQDVVRQVYEGATEGSFREMGNFWDVFHNYGTNLAEAFKTFGVWNYFTNDRDDGAHYFNGDRYPRLGIHPDDVYTYYPIEQNLTHENMPEHFSTRYLVFEPDGRSEPFAIMIDGSDIEEPQDRNLLDQQGLRGWGVKLIIEHADGRTSVDEILPFQRSQLGQRTFENFGRNIRRIVMSLANLTPDVETPGVGIRYAAGKPPVGRLSEPTVFLSQTGSVILEWEVLDVTDIREVLIIRKRYASGMGDFDNSPLTPASAIQAGDMDFNGIPDAQTQVVGRVSATTTYFEDTQIFNDVDLNNSQGEPANVVYYYAIVPVNAFGLMGTASVDVLGVIPTNSAPLFVVEATPLAPGSWTVFVLSSKNLTQTPALSYTLPDGRRLAIVLQQVGTRRWQGELHVPGVSVSGSGRFRIMGEDLLGQRGNIIITGEYLDLPSISAIRVQPTILRDDGRFQFSPQGLRIKIYSLDGSLVADLRNAREWNGMTLSGEQAVNGTYFYIAEDDKGFQSKGRIVLIR